MSVVAFSDSHEKESSLAQKRSPLISSEITKSGLLAPIHSEISAEEVPGVRTMLQVAPATQLSCTRRRCLAVRPWSIILVLTSVWNQNTPPWVSLLMSGGHDANPSLQCRVKSGAWRRRPEGALISSAVTSFHGWTVVWLGDGTGTLGGTWMPQQPSAYPFHGRSNHNMIWRGSVE